MLNILTFLILIFCIIHCIIPFGKFGPPYLGTATASATAALYPVIQTSQHNIFDSEQVSHIFLTGFEPRVFGSRVRCSTTTEPPRHTAGMEGGGDAQDKTRTSSEDEK